MFDFFKRRRRREIKSKPFLETWRKSLRDKFRIYSSLSEADRRELEGHIQIFVAEKRFEGCGGFKITDEARVLIAAQACLLLLHRETDYYPAVRTILVYPDTYVAKTRWREEDEDTERHARTRLGEAWHHGTVVLAWSSVLGGALNIEDGANLVFHEFAHQLDQEDGAYDGAPVLTADTFRERVRRYTAWTRVLRQEYEQLRADDDKGCKTVLDTYGATNPAEFFAVATECFFEKPRQMKQRHPELYEELKRFYQQDPLTYSLPAALSAGQASSP
jgi:Mlc titration factor MtfA (ptsG expression regulator)